MARAAGGTSHRLNPGGAMMRSRERNPAKAGDHTNKAEGKRQKAEGRRQKAEGRKGIVMRSTAAIVTLVVLSLVVPSRAQTPNWHLTATVAESCSCKIACRCNFGGEPDGDKCEGNRIISIEKGHYNDVDLAGVQLLVTFQMRTWSKIYISDKVSDQQMKAVEALMPLAFAGFQKGMSRIRCS